MLGGTRKDRPGHPWTWWSQVEESTEPAQAKELNPRRQENLHGLACADRTEIQHRWVGVNAPRRSRELWLRNSAKCPRNFGRRGAIDVYGLAPKSVWWPQRLVGSDCLLKTQVRAKSQDDVYGLTPARCWKVKRTGQLFGAKLRI